MVKSKITTHFFVKIYLKCDYLKIYSLIVFDFNTYRIVSMYKFRLLLMFIKYLN